MIRAPSGIRSAGRPVGVAGAVPALVVVQHPVGDGVDAEALEHPEADLRVALEHEALGLCQRRRLAEDLLGDRELAEVVQRAGEPDQLDQLRVGAHAATRSSPRARRRARSGSRCTRRARRPPSRGSRRRGSGPPGRGRRRDAAAPPARPRPGDRPALGSCRAPSPSRARSRQDGSARRGRRPGPGRSQGRR